MTSQLPITPVFGEDDLAFFEKNGYLCLSDAVPARNLEAAINAIFTFLGMDPHDPSDWYRAPLPTIGMVELYHHQALWDNRQHPRIHAAFAQLWETEKLWVSIDRVGFKPPVNEEKPEWNHKGFLHLDASLDERPIRFGLQGVLALADTTEEMGGFHCLPGWHTPAQQDEFAKLVEGRERPSLYGDDIPWDLGVTPIPMKAGDLVIWHRALPHGNGLNRGRSPRLAQYLNLFRAPKNDESKREERVSLWRERRPPNAPWVQGDPRNWETKHGTTANLTPLGKKLLGLESW